MTQQLQRLKLISVALDIGSTAVMSKADEYCRMLDSRGPACLKMLNLVGESKLYICMECAATELGHSIDKKLTIERSGMTKKNYQTALRSIKSMLSIQKNVSIRESAVTLGHAELSEPAAALLKRYLDWGLGGDTSLITSAVNIAAIAVVAKKEGVNLKVTKLTDMAACTKATLDKIKTHMEKLVASDVLVKQTSVADSPNAAARSSPRKRKSTTNDQEHGCQSLAKSAVKSKLMCKLEDDHKPSDSDSFEVWKNKILTAAKLRLKSKS